MTPSIPLSPGQKRKRRNNIIFFSICASVTAGILGYLFIPGGEEKKAPAPEPEAVAAQTPAVPAAPAAPPAAPQAQSEEATTPAPSPAAPEAAPAATQSPEASPQPSVQLPGNAPEPSEEAEGDTALELTEEELARLPTWQADFARLSARERIAYATAFTKAKAAYNAEQWTNCLVLLNDCELIYKGSPNVWNLRACALLGNGELDAAEASLSRSLEINPNDSVALMCQSELHMLRGDFRGSITVLEKLRRLHLADADQSLHDAFTFHQLLCHLMLRQEMEAQALVAGLTPLSDTPLYYFAEAAFCVYKGDSSGALEPLRSVTAIFGNGGVTSSYRKWMSKCGLADKYVRNRKR